MKFDLPTKASQEVLEIDAREVEAVLQGPSLNLKPWPGAMIPLKDGRTLYIREAQPGRSADDAGLRQALPGCRPRLL